MRESPPRDPARSLLPVARRDLPPAQAAPPRSSASAASATNALRGREDPRVLDCLDALLHWLASPDAPEARLLRAAFRELGVEREAARRTAFRLLDQLLFAHVDDPPERVLGFAETATAGTLRSRYRLLMRVYHPDRAGDAELRADAAARLGAAYERLKAPGPARRARALSSLTRALAPRASRGPRALGPPGAGRLRRRLVLAACALSAALVVHACVVEQVGSRTW